MTIDYQQQAIDFLKKTSAVMSITYLKTGKHFIDDKEERDIYTCVLSKDNRSYTFRFGNSLNNSHYKIATRKFTRNELKGCLTKEGRVDSFKFSNKYFTLSPAERAAITYPSAPTEYDVLACLTKYDPGTFENFCSEFGYDTDSRKAESTYNAVREEYLQLSRLFSEQELEEMNEIQ